MIFDNQDIAAIQSLGYTYAEARFLYLVAVHSGYFVTRQFLTFTGANWGSRSYNFVSKLESNGHVTWRKHDPIGGVYHLSRRLFTGRFERRTSLPASAIAPSLSAHGWCFWISFLRTWDSPISKLKAKRRLIS